MSLLPGSRCGNCGVDLSMYPAGATAHDCGLRPSHPVYPGGPDCQPNCPGPHSMYHDGYADGYENAEAARTPRETPAPERDFRRTGRVSVSDVALDAAYELRHRKPDVSDDAIADVLERAVAEHRETPDLDAGLPAMRAAIFERHNSSSDTGHAACFDYCEDAICLALRTWPDESDRETPAGAVEALARAMAVTYEATAGYHHGPVPHTLEEASEHWGEYEPQAQDILAALASRGYSLTCSVDVERWQRIETAARLVLRMEDEKRLEDNSGTGALDDLRDALGEG